MTMDLFSAFLVGLLGSGHCLSMCGGITTMLTSAINPKKVSVGDIKVTQQTIEEPTPIYSTSSRVSLVFLYNLGRIISYSTIGAIVGLTGSIAAKNIGLPIAGLRIFAAIFMILLGLYIGQWLMWLTHVEKLGTFIWKRISPLSRKILPVNSPAKALGLGALWGWLPCGLVYSCLTWAMASGDLYRGASIMLFFGLGTLPALLTLSLSLEKVKALITMPTFRQTSSILLITYGIYSFFVAYQLMF